jgi:exopolysaccharide production protein ExoZ
MRPTLHNLQALRGIACLVVVLYHIGGYENTFWTKWRTFHVVRWFGYAGVDVFFALSGFIITWAHRDQLGQAGRFPRYLFRRFRRIYPVLWASAIATIVMIAALGTAIVFPPGWQRDYAEWMLLVPRYDPFRFIAATWSLNYEILFYFAFGLLFLVPKRWALPLAFGWALAIAGAWAVNFSPTPFWAKMLVSPYVLEFLGGAGVAAVVARGFVRGPRVALGLAIVWTAVCVTALRGANPDDLGGMQWPRVVAFGPASILLVYAVVAGELTGRLHLPARLRPVGDASYSIYLMHGPVTLTLVFLMWGMNTNLPTHLLWIAVQLAAGIGAGWLLYVLVERPLLSRKPKPATTAATVSTPQFSLRA